MAIATTTVNNNPQLADINTRIYNGQKYQIDIIFDNLQGNRFQLNLASVVGLDISEDIREWYKRATLTIRNPDNALESKITSSDTPDKYYKFRNDGRDLVYIVIKPIEDSQLNETNAQIDYDVWGMSYVFSIYDRKEIAGQTSKEKALKLYLWEYEYQVFIETALQWSTNEALPTSISPAYATDSQKLVPTGVALKNLITKASQNYITPGPTFSSDWDVGASKIFYTTPANYTVSDTIEYLVKKHVSAQIGSDGGGDPAILSRTRFTAQWSLLSYSNFFSKAVSNKSSGPGLSVSQAGDLQREIITLSNQSGPDTDEFVFSLPNSPFKSTTNPYTNYQNPTTSNIKNVQFVDMATLDNTNEIISTPCYSNDYKNKLFQLDFNNNNIENVKSFIDKNYSNKFKVYAKPDTLLTLNKQKTNALTLKNVYSQNADKVSQLAESRNFLLAAAVFFNASLSFTAGGSPIREAGTFISLESQTPAVASEFTSKLLGQWLVYKVTHSFTENDYTNNITALRLHANDAINIRSDIT